MKGYFTSLSTPCYVISRQQPSKW